MLSTSTETVIRSFDRRSGYFSQESTWSTVDSLNNYICTALLTYITTQSNPFVVLDYGAGNGAVGRVLSEKSIIVDVADLSDKMLSLCDFARHKFNVTSELPNGFYDGIILRQVLQYIEQSNWKDFMKKLLSHLLMGGCLIFSQIVPYCRADYDFWCDLVAARRPARQSFPTENEFLSLCEQVDAKIVHFSHSYTRQSLKDWVSHEDVALQRKITNLIESRSNAVDAIWAFEEHKDGDLSWRNNWVHIVIQV